MHQVRPSALHAVAEEWCERYGPIFRFDLGPRRIVGIGDLDAINAILRDRPEGFGRWREMREKSEETGVSGLTVAEGDKWRRQRRMVISALNTNHINRNFHIIRTSTERLYRRLRDAAQDGAAFDIGAELESFAVDITSALVFGHDLNTLERRDNELQGHIKTVMEGIGRRLGMPIPYWRWVRLPADRAADRSRAEVRRAVEDFIEHARARMAERPELRERPENFLEGMLAAQEAEGVLTDEEIIGNTFTLLLGGEDSTSHTIAWTLWLLAPRPDIQMRCADEADEVLGEDRFPATPDTVEQLPYGEAVLRESIRLKGVSPVIPIESLKDATVADTYFPAGTKLLLLTRFPSIHGNGFKHPGDFDPERWLRDDDAHGERDPKPSLAFGAGPRFCPGRNLAFLESKTALAMIAKNFVVELDDSAAPVQEAFSLFMVPRGLRVRLRERVGA
jgi:cytochrome P450